MYVAAVKSYMRNEGIEVDNYQFAYDLVYRPIWKRAWTVYRRMMKCAGYPSLQQKPGALIALLASSGMRIGEAGNLRVGNLDLLGNKVTVIGREARAAEPEPHSSQTKPPSSSVNI